ncbi:hypothetical protein EX895_000323 [Sporisorium graminicola]|uniref:Uncharacterized protein n=1 Tax=Sporisorium graminicola TaxID=280036 RepID=A0A4U7KZQ1_9BASI|nr:hypothetical protein EX895_000323 [Sporisorium graminicola]TKY90325.1 hypothetical protein EX895_000323 [Sporisorium graminicola]
MLRSAVSRTTLKAVGQGGLGGSSSHAEPMHPNLGLHSAAATGNIGLVKFALENGQPANSNLNGILPLHAACSGGSEQSVRMLISHGADVNAPRLKAKGSTGGPGAEGSTPLHFAAANGHLEIVRILLEAGARPAAADKEGVVPEALALGNRHTDCANLIRSWISAYGSNGLAGMVEARETVSGDVTLGPAGYIRYAASRRSDSPLSPTSSSRSGQPTTTSSTNAAAPGSGSSQLSTLPTSPPSSQLTSQSSFDTLSANSASKPHATSRPPPSFKSASLSKTSSNPNLRNPASSAVSPPLGNASPALLSTNLSSSQSHFNPTSVIPNAVAASAGLGSFPAAHLQLDASTSSAATPVASGSVRESKRRPSIPSIFEKAAHPAASLRAALASGSSAQTSASLSQASSSRYLDHSYDAITSSPGKKHSKLAGKRSFSHILRKATGSSTGSGQQSALPPSSSSSFSDTTSAASSNNMLSGGAINMDALAKPGRTPGRSFDHQRASATASHRTARRNTALESLGDDPEAWNHSTPAPPPLPTSRSDAAVLDQQRTLRNASSSSSLSTARDPSLTDNQVGRSRAGSNEQLSSSSRFPLRANASLDLLRPTGHFGQSDDHGNSSATSATRKSSERYRASSNQNSRIDAMRRLASGSEGHGQYAGASAGVTHLASRDRSVSGSSSQSASTTDNERGQAHSTVEEAVEEEDLQEFLDHTVSGVGDHTTDGGERHDSHRLPAGLRTMTALRQQNSKDASDPQVAESATVRPALPPPGATNEDSSRNGGGTPASRMTRDRSGSHVSAISSSSQSGHSSRGIDVGLRSSPGLAPSFQALSIAEENGLTSSVGHTTAPGGSSTSLNRAGRAPSVAESVTSHASSSSLRSNYLSAAEQAQAILNHEAPYASDGPDGTSTSLAAQLAAYGEALAVERRRAGDARTGPSPSLSARGSNAALRSKLPSVSEDQLPSRSAGHSSRSFSVSEQRTPNYPATAAQSYNRRVSRRPHSSEGRQSQEGAKRGFFGGSTATNGPSALPATDSARSELERSPAAHDSTQAQRQGQEKAGVTPSSHLPSDRDETGSPNLADRDRLDSPVHEDTTQAQTSAEAATRSAKAGGDALASDRSDDIGPTVPPKDQPRRRHEPVVLSSASGLPASMILQGGNATAAEMGDDDEDDPKTPVLGGTRAVLDKLEPSPGSLHRHSPSLPTKLSSYERLPREALADNVDASSTLSSTPPVPPPRKESIHTRALGSGLGIDEPSISDDSRMLTPDSAMWSSWRAGGGASGHEDGMSHNKVTDSTSSSRWEGLRRPSLNMLRSATSSSTHSQTPSHASSVGCEGYSHGRWSTDESMSGGKADLASNSSTASAGGGTGKRGLVRNLLNKAKGST